MISQSQQSRPSRRYLADVLFLIDSSGSMTSCFQGVIDHIDTFVKGLEIDANKPVDFRLAAMSAGSDSFQIGSFSPDIETFRRSLRAMSCDGNNEYTLPALDIALDSEWRQGAQKIIVIFTDEPIEGGRDPSFQRSKLDELINKLIALKASIHIYAPECPSFKRIAQSPHSFYTIVNNDAFFSTNFADVLLQMGKTVSSSLDANNSPVSVGVSKDLYGVLSSGTPPITRI